MDHRDVMMALAVRHGWQLGVEVGVGSGLLLHRLLFAGLRMVGVDIGANAERLTLQRGIADRFPDTCRLLTMPSVEAARYVDDGLADFVFIDASHSYKAVKADIAAWAPKVREGGWLGGHDLHSAYPGVQQAVAEAFPYDVLDGWIWARR